MDPSRLVAIAALALLVVVTVGVKESDATHITGICYSRYSYRQAYTAYYRYSYSYSYSCGWWGWSRCSVTKYDRRSYSAYRTRYSSRFGCCSEYYRSGSRCYPICSLPCRNGGSCTDPDTCSCRSGWQGSYCQTDQNECLDGSHNCQDNCINTQGSYTCTCRTGYMLDSNQRNCSDINECRIGTHQCNHNCHNTVGSYTCSCRTGYYLAANGRTCNDIDECALGTHNCAQDCNNNPGSFTCACRLGYRLQNDGRSCNDIDECTEGTHQCDHNCSNNVGSYTCSCRTGYRLAADGRSCVDIDECRENIDGCDHDCHNTIGSYFCSCNTGYRLHSDGRACNDIDECAENTDGCEQVCTNTVGSYSCSCHSGYRLDADEHTCNDIDECAEGTHRCDQNCHNTIGSYTCSCNTGYRLNDDGFRCDDIDECTEGTHQCEHNCLNNIGSYTCSCQIGYRLNPDQRTCDDIDECAEGTHQCEHNCHNTIGSYTCSCRTGYRLNVDERGCDDIDECSENTHRCDQNCHNNIGSYTCSCNIGWLLDDDGFRCNDIDECDLGIDGCEHNCTNTLGSYLCSCFLGYRLNSDLHSCSDINECTEPDDAPTADRCDQNCHNNIGSYTCSCGIGWLLDADGFRCNDIDECEPTGIGRNDDTACMQECVNTPGSYHCDCRTGYSLLADEISCTDIDECTELTARCTDICRNTIGSYTCSCHPGYFLNETDNAQCHDVNECTDGNPCGHTSTCTNTVGGFYCNCTSGTNLGPDGRTCNDIDECALGIDHCEHGCENTAGSFVCFCDPSHTKTDDEISCLGVPQNVLVNNIGARQVLVEWSPPEFDPRDGNISNYTIVCRSPDDRTYFQQVVVDGSTMQYTIEGATPFTTYECCITVKTTNGDSPFACADDRTDQDTPDSPPSSIGVTPDDPYYLRVTWDLPAQPSGVITQYKLYIDYLNGTVTPVVLDNTILSYDIAGLKPYQTIAVSVSASTLAGEGPVSGIGTYTTLESAPSTVEATYAVNSDSSFVVTWDVPSVPNGIITQYVVSVYNKRNGFDQSFTVLADQDRTITLSDLSPYTPYNVEIVAHTSAGGGEPNVQIVYTKEKAPVQPQITATPRMSGTNSLIAWQPLTPDDAHGYLTQIDVAYVEAPMDSDCSDTNPSEEGMVIVVTTNLNTSQFVFDSLQPDKEYCVSVQASTAVGPSGYSAPIKITLPMSNLFQVRFTLTDGQDCEEFIAENREQKISDIKNAISTYVKANCDCSVFSSQYLTDASIVCDNPSAKEFILMSKLLSTSELSSGDIRDRFVQDWIDSEPVVPIGGETLELNSYCNATLDNLDGSPTCFAPRPTSAPGGFNVGQRTVILALEVVGGIGGAALLALIIFIPVCIACCCCARRGTRQKYHEPRREGLDIQGRRPGSATSQRALLTNAERIGTLKRSKDMTGTLPRNKHVVSDYEAEYPVVNSGESMDRPKLDLSEDPKRSSLGYDNPSYDDAGDDFEYK